MFYKGKGNFTAPSWPGGSFPGEVKIKTDVNVDPEDVDPNAGAAELMLDLISEESLVFTNGSSTFWSHARRPHHRGGAGPRLCL